MEEEKKNNEVTYNINGNPSQNNTFINVKVEKAINVNPNATTIENKFYFGADGDLKEMAVKETGITLPTEKPAEKPAGKKLSNMTLREMLEQDLIDTTPIQKEIMNYVSCIRPKVKDELDRLYMQLWARILEHDVFKIDLYDSGKMDSKFNRNLVANIMHYLDSKQFYKEPYNQSAMARAVEGDADNPIRKAFRFEPDEKYCKAIDEIIKDLKEKNA